MLKLRHSNRLLAMASRLLVVRASRILTQTSTQSITFRQILTPTTFRSFSDQNLIPGVGKGKTSTGLVGLAVDYDAVPKIISKYQALLDRIAESDMPKDAQYRINVEQICNYRIRAATENPNDPEKVEELCNCGQVEELVEQADDEMIVLKMMLKNRWWELVKPVEVEENPPEDGDHGDIEWDDELEKNTKES